MARHAQRVCTTRADLWNANAARSQSVGPLRVTSMGTVLRGTKGSDYTLPVVRGETFWCTCHPLGSVIVTAEGSASERLPTQCAKSRTLVISFRSENNLQFFGGCALAGLPRVWTQIEKRLFCLLQPWNNLKKLEPPGVKKSIGSLLGMLLC